MNCVSKLNDLNTVIKPVREESGRVRKIIEFHLGLHSVDCMCIVERFLLKVLNHFLFGKRFKESRIDKLFLTVCLRRPQINESNCC